MMSTLKYPATAAALLFALTLAAYSNSFDAGLQFDDYHQITENHNIRSLGNVPGFFTDAGTGSFIAGLKGYRPVTHSTFAVNYAVSGYHVWSYHLLNFLLHFMNSFLVFLIVGMVLEKAGRKAEFFTALSASLLFALHPVQTGAVTYISGRAGLLAGFFCLLSFTAFLRFRAGGAHRLLWAFAAPLLFMLGLLSKEAAAGLMGVMVAYDLIFTVPGKGGVSKGAGRAFYCYLPFVFVLGAYLSLRKALQGYAVLESMGYGMREYMMSEAKALLMYLRLLFLPMNQNADYGLPVTSSPDPLVAVSAVLVVLAAAWLYKLRRVEPAAAFFGCWFFLALAPESSIIPIPDIAVEYRLYMPSAGLIALAVIVAGRLLKAPALRKGLAVSAVVLFGLLTFNRNLVWANEYTFWGDVVKKSPDSARAHSNMGSALMDRGRCLDAVYELKKTLETDPRYAQSYNVHTKLGMCYWGLGMKDEAVSELGRAIEEHPGNIDAYEKLGRVFCKLKRYDDAVEVLLRGKGINPGYSPVRFVLAVSYEKLGRHGDALAELKEAARYAPKDFEVRYALAMSYRQNKMMDKAALEARAAADLAPGEEERMHALEVLDGMP